MSVYVVYHFPQKYLRSDFYLPICVGTKKDSLPEEFLRDDRGENIASLNDRYNELTALYFVWKNRAQEEEYIGLAHYRRYLGVGMKKSHYLYRSFFRAKPKMERAEKNYLSMAKKPDIVAPNPAHHGAVKDYYSIAHGGEDIKTLLSVIDRFYPSYSDCAHRYFEGQNDFLCNLFIMKKDIFMRYAEWLFDVLKRFVEECAGGGRLYVSERLTGVFIQKMIEEGKTVQFAPMITVEPRTKMADAIKKVSASQERGKLKWKPLLHSMIPTLLWRRYYRGVYKVR